MINLRKERMGGDSRAVTGESSERMAIRTLGAGCLLVKEKSKVNKERNKGISWIQRARCERSAWSCYRAAYSLNLILFAQICN